MGEVSILATTPLSASRGLPLWISMWGSLFGRTANSLRSDSCGRERFEGRLEYISIGALKLCRINASPHRVVRIAAADHADSRAYKLVIQVRGSSTFEQAGRTSSISPNEWTIYDTGKPYRICNLEEVEQYALTAPREVFGGRSRGIDHLVAQPFSACTGVGRLACSMMRSAFEEIAQSQLQVTEELADSIVGMFRQAFSESSDKSGDMSRADVLRDRIKNYIQCNLRDPELSIDRLSQVLNHTKRNLHRVFSPEGQTISDFIWQTRLDWSRRALRNPALEHHSITDIAYGCGFSSSAHFSRSFKEAFGLSPRDYRSGSRSHPPDLARRTGTHC